MPRLTKIFAVIGSKRVFDGDSNAELNTSTYPYTSAKELSQVAVQYCETFTDNQTFTPYTGFVGQTVSSTAVIDNDFNSVDSGTLAVSLPVGVTAQVEITQSSLANIPQLTGSIRLINSGSLTETVAYSTVSLVGANYVFEVDGVTLVNSYDVGNRAETNDPPLVKSTTVDVTDKDTGLFIVEIDTNTQPYLLAVEGRSFIAGSISTTGCLFEQQVRDNTGQKIFEFKFPFLCNNSLDDDGALPPPVGFDFYTKVEVDAQFPRIDSTNVDSGTALIATDEVWVTDIATGNLKKRPVSEIATGSQTGGLDDVVAGTNITIDKTDPKNPIISSTATGGSDLEVTDGSTSVTSVDKITFSGAVVSDDGNGDTTVTITGGGGVTTYLGLTDTPSSRTGQSGKVLACNSGETADEYIEISASSDHATLSNLQLAGTGVTYGHINDQAQTIAGVKTFSSSPIVPAPTTDLQAATKKYVDDNAGGGGATTYLALTDTDNSYTGQAGKIPVVNGTETALEFQNVIALPSIKTSTTGNQTFVEGDFATVRESTDAGEVIFTIPDTVSNNALFSYKRGVGAGNIIVKNTTGDTIIATTNDQAQTEALLFNTVDGFYIPWR